MKIVHICIQAIYNDNWGYQENLLPKYHRKLGCDVTVITTNKEYYDSKIIEIEPCEYDLLDGEHIIRLRMKKIFSTKVDGIICKYDVYSLLCKISPDLIMFHGLGSITALQLLKYKKIKPNCKIVADNHLDYYNGKIKKILKIYYKLLNKYTQSVYEKVYGVTPWSVKYQQEIFGIKHEKCDLLVMGGDDEKIHFDKQSNILVRIRESLNLSHDDFVIITGGKIDRRKNIHLLMRAIVEMNNPRIKLIVFGKPNNEMKSEIEKYKCNNNVRYIGWIASDKVYDYFLASNIGCFPGTQSVLWEQACACGLPCIFKQWKEMSHLNVGGNCIFIKGDDVLEIKNIITEIYENKILYNRMKYYAVYKGKKEFSYLEIAKKVLGIIK